MRYVVEKRESSKRTYSFVATATELALNAGSLTKGQALVLGVAAENECGVGEFVELEAPLSPGTEFSE